MDMVGDGNFATYSGSKEDYYSLPHCIYNYKSGKYSEEGIIDCRLYGSFYYNRKCGMPYMEEQEVLKHWAICTAYRSSCHVVHRACRSIEKLITAKQIVATANAEKNP